MDTEPFIDLGLEAVPCPLLIAIVNLNLRLDDSTSHSRVRRHQLDSSLLPAPPSQSSQDGSRNVPLLGQCRPHSLDCKRSPASSRPTTVVESLCFASFDFLCADAPALRTASYMLTLSAISGGWFKTICESEQQPSVLVDTRRRRRERHELTCLSVLRLPTPCHASARPKCSYVVHSLPPASSTSTAH